MRQAIQTRWKFVESSAVAATLLVICVALTISRSQFATGSNITNILEQVSMIGIIAMGMTMLLVSANFDLSVGGIVGLTGVIAAKIANSSGLIAGVAAAIVVATSLGGINGFIVTRLRVNSLVATLGTGLVYLGLAFLLSNNAPVTLNSQHLTTIVNTKFLGVAVPVYVFAGVIAASAWFLHTTVGGRQLYAVGANAEAARYAGVRVEVLRFMPFVVTGLYSGVASLILLGLLSSGVPDGATSWPLQVVAAVVVGGVSIAGGQGTILMAVLGVLLIGVINNGLNLLNLAASWQNITTGAVLVTAVAADSVLRERGRRRASKRASEVEAAPLVRQTPDDRDLMPLRQAPPG
jgi:ribose/xylose/arabinose/galactoside ABC-type transport system permease subunit